MDRLARELERENPQLAAWAARAGAREAVEAARSALAQSAGAPDLTALRRAAVRAAQALAAPHPRRVINATGVVLHTNLGRAPLAPGAAAAAAEAAVGYCDLELDLASGRRGDRLGTLCRKLVLLSGAEAAHACNNNAAALLLALDSLARGREVVVSRGELIEIGGSFRVPEIVERAGVRLVEVGTTNRTHPRDYERAIGPETGLLLKVHRSNFEQRGFTREVDLATLVAIGRAHGIPVVEDLGSGTLVDLRERGLPAESYAPARVAMGADVVCFSGDKLLGGPQAGLLLGRAEALGAMRTNPLARALRLDKLGIAALDWTLHALLDERLGEIPVLRMLQEPIASVERRAAGLERLAREASAGERGVSVGVEALRAPVGGGSLPGFELETRAVVVRAPGGPERLAAALRAAPRPVLARIRDDALLLDARTIAADELADVGRALQRAFEPEDRRAAGEGAALR